MTQQAVEPVWHKEKGVGEHLPYSAQIDRRTIRLRDRRLMQVIELEAMLPKTARSIAKFQLIGATSL